ncbi:MAG: hypothetical protein HYZ15_06490 [Sphingobacteriales bacterium]|nr:hypothetical protein [Sphingobacteriales bacterium]
MVGLKIENDFYLIGTAEFLISFFDNIHYHLERNKHWGERYPLLLNSLYTNGKLCVSDIDKAVEELLEIKDKFKAIKAHEAIWDINDLKKVALETTSQVKANSNLAEYFITPDGINIFDIFFEAFEISKIYKWDVIIWNMFKSMNDQPKPSQNK